MTEHFDRFNGRAARYAQFRERYEPELVLPLLRNWCGLAPEWTVADVGTGTGMLGDLFRANGNRVIAIEPNAEMRTACAQLHASDDLFDVVEGSAEKTGLPDASLEMVAIGRALHWFDVKLAFHEFRRILEPGGWVAIVACGRREDGSEENLALTQLLRSSGGRDPSIELHLSVYQRMEELFQGGEFHHAEMDGAMQLDWERLHGLTLSLSHVPMPGTPDYPAFETSLRDYFDRYEQAGKVTQSTRTWINAGRFTH